MTAPAAKTRQRVALAHIEAEREQRRIAADYREALGIQGAVAPPAELVERIERIEEVARDQARVIENQGARIAELERLLTHAPAESEDGRSRPPGRWLRMKAAAKVTGRSVNGLKKLCRQGRVVFDDDAPRRLINVDTVPSRVSKVSVVSP
jgi:hypothetical protein